jgi:hypothetical protein
MDDQYQTLVKFLKAIMVEMPELPVYLMMLIEEAELNGLNEIPEYKRILEALLKVMVESNGKN